MAYLLAITCGMRKGEILGLQWKDIDFERRTLSVNRSLISQRSFMNQKPLLEKDCWFCLKLL
ncbi:tyrosine-type recombinase/integrase [Bacillus thuringiensis]|uniref:tyrosine-type recombinase/integrase n=1 Tax=Bacillus thuringiensis TaxID=1428 RepID=UPI003F6C9A2C